MDKIHEGWLVKSPPDWKKHVTLFKLKKWRRRYFVLYSPPISCIVPGTCNTQLCYYENETLSRECGRIDLKNCEEIISQLETDDYKHVLALETAFKNQTRIYYLAADSEEDLETWMEKISYVLSISGDEFIEVSRKEAKEKSKKSKSKAISTKSKSIKPQSKPSGISLRRSTSTLSKSSTSINILNRPITNMTSHPPTQTFGKFSKQSSSDTPPITSIPDPCESEAAIVKSSIRSKPSFLNKIKQLKSNSSRPFCPIIIPTQPSTEETTSTPSILLRPNPSNPIRFQGSSSSSVISFASDYKTPDVTSPIMPSLFYQTIKKYEVNECSLRLDSKFSPFSEPPPLPPKIRSSDAGLSVENITPNVNPIYDVPAHKYGSYDINEEETLEELEGLTRFEGVYLSVVNEREDEGMENDLNLDEFREEVLESIPPPLPERRRPRVEETYRHSSGSEYDVLPFSGSLRTNLSDEDNKRNSNDSDGGHDRTPLTRIADDEIEMSFGPHPPPLPDRIKKKFDEAIFGKLMTDQSSSTSESNDNINGFVDKLSINDLCSIDDLSKDNVSYLNNLKLLSQIEDNYFAESVKNGPLMRMKSKSLENIERDPLMTCEDYSKEFLHRTSTCDNEDKLIRTTFKTRSFKKKNDACENEHESSASSLESTSSPASEVRKPFVINDHFLY